MVLPNSCSSSRRPAVYGVLKVSFLGRLQLGRAAARATFSHERRDVGAIDRSVGAVTARAARPDRGAVPLGRPAVKRASPRSARTTSSRVARHRRLEAESRAECQIDDPARVRRLAVSARQGCQRRQAAQQSGRLSSDWLIPSKSRAVRRKRAARIATKAPARPRRICSPGVFKRRVAAIRRGRRRFETAADRCTSRRPGLGPFAAASILESRNSPSGSSQPQAVAGPSASAGSTAPPARACTSQSQVEHAAPRRRDRRCAAKPSVPALRTCRRRPHAGRSAGSDDFSQAPRLFRAPGCRRRAERAFQPAAACGGVQVLAGRRLVSSRHAAEALRRSRRSGIRPASRATLQAWSRSDRRPGPDPRGEDAVPRAATRSASRVSRQSLAPRLARRSSRSAPPPNAGGSSPRGARCERCPAGPSRMPAERWRRAARSSRSSGPPARADPRRRRAQARPPATSARTEAQAGPELDCLLQEKPRRRARRRHVAHAPRGIAPAAALAGPCRRPGARSPCAASGCRRCRACEPCVVGGSSGRGRTRACRPANRGSGSTAR